MEIQKYLAKTNDSIKNVIEIINNNKDGIALVINEDGCLIGTITDGDIRRFMLSGGILTDSCSKVMYSKPVTASPKFTREKLIRLIKQHRIRNIPLVDDDNRPIQLVDIADLINDKKPEIFAVIMAGGEGRRLLPLTENLPKPMIQIGDRPLIEQIIKNLAKSNIRNIYISVNYRADVIENYFKDGADFDVEIKYLREDKKLGTAGALSLIDEIPSNPLLVINGDVVTSINFDRLLEFHSLQRFVMTIAAMEYHLNIPYGVIELAGHYVLRIDEKPTKRFLCNAGIYAIDPEIIHMVPKNMCYDMTDLLRDVVNKGLPVAAFPIHEYWVDIGQKEDLKRVKEDFRLHNNNKSSEVT